MAASGGPPARLRMGSSKVVPGPNGRTIRIGPRRLAPSLSPTTADLGMLHHLGNAHPWGDDREANQAVRAAESVERLRKSGCD